MRKFISISFLTFKGAIRDKFFLGIVFFFISYLFFCVFLGKLSVGHTDKVMRDTGLIGIELTTIILIIFTFILSFFRERESRFLEVYLTHFSPATYLGGKIFGFLLLVLFYLSLSAVGFALILKLHGAFHYTALLAVYPIFLKAVIVICLSCLFSCLFSSAIVTLLCTLFLYLTAEMVPTALAIVQAYSGKTQQMLMQALYAFLPNMDKLNINAFALAEKAPGGQYFFWITLYTLAYGLFLWLISLFIFQRAEY